MILSARYPHILLALLCLRTVATSARAEPLLTRGRKTGRSSRML
jgi:hypothetical protein